MKIQRTTLFKSGMLIVLSILALSGCNLFFGQNVQKGDTPAYLEYSMFLPKSEKEFESAVSAGDIARDTVIVKTSKDFDPSLFAENGFEKIASFTLNNNCYYRLRTSEKTLEKTFKKARRLERLNGVIYVEHEHISHIPDYECGPATDTGGSSKGADEISEVLDDPETWGRYGHF